MPPPSYPLAPGHQGTETSRLAAQHAALHSPQLCAAALRLLARQPLTAYEAAATLGRHYITVHPRFSELRALGLIEPSGQRRLSPFGRPAAVWRLTAGPRPTWLPPGINQALDEAEAIRAASAAQTPPTPENR